MYYISDYKKQAIEKIIPYLIEFPQIVSIVEKSAERYQAIEDTLWSIATNFQVDNSRGIFLTANANNEVVDIVYTDVAKDAFTYGTKEPQYRAYGAGHYYSQNSHISGIKKDVSEDKLIRAVKAKIIQNNTNGTIEDLIESLKLYFNATHVKIYESNPLNISLLLEGKDLEISSSGNYDIIKKMLPCCVKLNNLYVDTHSFDIFQYDNNSFYGDSRYPVLVGDTVDLYTYISQSVGLGDEFEEYYILDQTFQDKNYMLITGSFKEINNDAVLSSFNDGENNIFNIKTVAEGDKKYIGINFNDTFYKIDKEISETQPYTFILYNDNGDIKLWVIDGVKIVGASINQDLSFIVNQINGSTPDLSVEGYNNNSNKIIVNALRQNETTSNFSNFIYFAHLIGKCENTLEASTIDKYYVTCYGEKQMIFNCIDNSNHIYINTKNPLVSNILEKQSYFNYKATHSGNRYIYLDGKSGINYNISKTTNKCYIDKMSLSFDVCMPIDMSKGNIVSDFIGTTNSESKIFFDENNSLCISFPETFDALETDIETTSKITNINTYKTDNDIIKAGEFANFKIELSSSLFSFYKNGELIKTQSINGRMNDTPITMRLGYDKQIENPYKGFIRNFYLYLKGVSTESETEGETYEVEVDIPLTINLKDKSSKIEYVNYRARFLSVPQLISDTKNVDIYNQELKTIR